MGVGVGVRVGVGTDVGVGSGVGVGVEVGVGTGVDVGADVAVGTGGNVIVPSGTDSSVGPDPQAATNNVRTVERRSVSVALRRMISLRTSASPCRFG